MRSRVANYNLELLQAANVPVLAMLSSYKPSAQMRGSLVKPSAQTEGQFVHELLGT